MDPDLIAETYVKLALAIDQHRHGYVDSFYGPPEWKLQAEQTSLRPLDELFDLANDLAEAIDSATELDSQRRNYLRVETRAMVTTLRLLQGEPLSLAEEVEGVYDICPAWVDEHVFEQARRELDDLLPMSGTLNERMIRRSRVLEVPHERLPALSQYIVGELRKRTRQLFPIPEEETLALETPQVDEPWGGYHTYMGNYRSQVQINTSLPKQALELVSMLAHETYPGHHTEAVIKEARLTRGLRQLEHCLIMGNAPSCVIQEGIAMEAIHILMDKNELAEWYTNEIFPRAGLRGLDAQRELQINQVRWKLEEAFGNLAFLVHEQGASRAEALAYIDQYVPELPENVQAMIDFIQSPLWRAYAFTYTYGYRLLDQLLSNRGERLVWFTRLLSEPLTASMVKEWIN
jgi:hypothetical protein